MSENTQQATGTKIQQFREQLIAHANYLMGRGGAPFYMRDIELTRVIVEKFRFERGEFASCSFSFSSFAGANFVGAKLSSTVFAHCNLSGCDFNKADMRAVSIVHSNMSEAKMAGARGAEAFFNFSADGDYSISFKNGASQAYSTDFSNSNFTGADLTGANMPGAKFANANLEGVNLSNANLSGADMSGVNLTGARFEGAVLANVKLDGATFSMDDETRKVLAGNPAFEEFVKGQEKIKDVLRDHEAWVWSKSASGIKANFAKANLKGGDFRYRTLAALNFNAAELRACLFNEAVLAVSDFSNTRASYCNFANADLRGIRFAGASFEFCSFAGADFLPLAVKGHADGVASNFDGAVFTNCDLTDAKLTPALLQKAKFINCTREASKAG